MGRLNKRQLMVVVGGPLVILGVAMSLRVCSNAVAGLVSMALTGMFLAYLIVEARGHGVGLFERLLGEGRAGYAQTEALQSLLWTLKPTAPLSSTRSWAASPDLLLEIANHVLREKPTDVVEASSGTSTLIIALCLQKLGGGRVIALEHDAVYAGKTAAAIRMHGLAEFATVVHAPLVRHTIGGGQHAWYDLSKVSLPERIDLLVVDGPPDTVQPLARYPAVPLLADRLASGARVLLDDGSRPDERTTAQRWAAECPGSELEFLPLEAGAWSLRLP